MEKDFRFGAAASDSVYWRIFVSFVLGGKGSVYAAVLCLPAAVLHMGVWLAGGQNKGLGNRGVKDGDS